MPVTLCFIKDKHKVMEHKILLETYFAGLLQKVEWQIQEYEDTAADTLTLCRLCVDYLQEILGELKTFIISYPFASTEEEIHFFKELKPLFLFPALFCVFLRGYLKDTPCRSRSGSMSMRTRW